MLRVGAYDIFHDEEGGEGEKTADGQQQQKQGGQQGGTDIGISDADIDNLLVRSAPSAQASSSSGSSGSSGSGDGDGDGGSSGGGNVLADWAPCRIRTSGESVIW